MQHGIHFIAGLPRSGSTLLADILRQNPRIHAAMTSPVGTLFAVLLGQMSQIDSLERLVQRNKFEPSKIFGFDGAGTVYHRVDALLGMNGMVGSAYNALKEGYYGEHTDRLMLLTYETLARAPAQAMAAVYDFIGAPPFAHDFDRVDYAEDEFDARIGTPGLHRLAAKVQRVERQMVLPPDVVRRVENDSFWSDSKRNLRGVRVV